MATKIPENIPSYPTLPLVTLNESIKTTPQNSRISKIAFTILVIAIVLTPFTLGGSLLITGLFYLIYTHTCQKTKKIVDTQLNLTKRETPQPILLQEPRSQQLSQSSTSLPNRKSGLGPNVAPAELFTIQSHIGNFLSKTAFALMQDIEEANFSGIDKSIISKSINSQKKTEKFHIFIEIELNTYNKKISPTEKRTVSIYKNNLYSLEELQNEIKIIKIKIKDFYDSNEAFQKSVDTALNQSQGPLKMECFNHINNTCLLKKVIKNPFCPFLEFSSEEDSI